MRNILFIVADQFRADLLTGALSSSVELPNLRRLMDEGVTFKNHHTVTTPCGPSRASLLTGLYAMNHRSIRNGTPLAGHHPTLGTEMRKAGYEPMLFGYTDISADPHGLHPNDPDLKSYEGVAPGFAEIVRLREATNYSWLADLKAKGYELPSNHADVFCPVAKDRNNAVAITDPAFYAAEDSDTAFLTDQTIRELSVRTDHSWFAMVTYIRPHPPLVAPEPYNSLVSPDTLPQPSQPLDIVEQKGLHPFFDAFFLEPSNRSLFHGFDGRMDKLSAQQTAELRAVYLGLAAELDHHIGRLLESLKQNGQYDDTLIVFTSDHGELLGDHFQWGKNSFHDPATHIPLIVRDPDHRSSAGTTVDAFTESIDVAPTLLDWVDREAPDAFNGHSLVPFVKGKIPDNWRECVFAEIDLSEPVQPTRFQNRFGLDLADCNYAFLRSGSYKYVHFNGGLPPLLFDLKKDESESVNLAEDPDHLSVRIEMMQKMIDHRMSHAQQSHTRMALTSDGVRRQPR